MQFKTLLSSFTFPSLLTLSLTAFTTASPAPTYLASPNVKFKPPTLPPNASIIAKGTSGWSNTDCTSLYGQIHKRWADKNLVGTSGGGGSGGGIAGVTGMSGAQKWEIFERVCEITYNKATPAGGVLSPRQAPPSPTIPNQSYWLPTPWVDTPVYCNEDQPSASIPLTDVVEAILEMDYLVQTYPDLCQTAKTTVANLPLYKRHLLYRHDQTNISLYVTPFLATELMGLPPADPTELLNCPTRNANKTEPAHDLIQDCGNLRVEYAGLAEACWNVTRQDYTGGEWKIIYSTKYIEKKPESGFVPDGWTPGACDVGYKMAIKYDDSLPEQGAGGDDVEVDLPEKEPEENVPGEDESGEDESGKDEPGEEESGQDDPEEDTSEPGKDGDDPDDSTSVPDPEPEKTETTKSTRTPKIPPPTQTLALPQPPSTGNSSGPTGDSSPDLPSETESPSPPETPKATCKRSKRAQR